MEKTETFEQAEVATLEESLHEIILFNDEVNTFDHVIECLILICDHSPEQAEQCALITHYKGKCGVKSGSYNELEPLCSNLLDQGLSAEIS
jgi:ATP-dependent Clp protease adaptor protein ClpS